MNPVLFAFILYALSTDKPIANSTLILAGHTTAYFIAGFGVAYTLEIISHRLANPESIDFILGLIIGLLLVYFGFKLFFTKSKIQESKKQNLTPIKSFLFGMIVNLIGIPFALPYFAVIDQILKSDLEYYNSLLILLVYNITYALPFFLVILFYLFYGEDSKAILEKVKKYIDKISAILMPLLLLGIGLFLIADASKYFLYGTGLF